MDWRERESGNYGDRAELIKLHANCFDLLRQYASSPDLWQLIQGATNTYTILALAERLDHTTGYSTTIPYILSLVHDQPPSTIDKPDPLSAEQYRISLQRTDNLTTEFTLNPQNSAINRRYRFNKAVDFEPFDGQFATDLRNIRIPTGLDEYAKYYEQYRFSQAYYVALDFFCYAQPAVIQAEFADSHALYQVHASENSSSNGCALPNLSLSMLRQPTGRSLANPLPQTVNLPFVGLMPTAYYPNAHRNAYVSIDLPVDFTIDGKPEQPGASETMAVTTTDQLLALLTTSSQLEVPHAAALLAQFNKGNTSQRRSFLNGMQDLLFR